MRWGWRDGSVVKKTDCGGWGFSSVVERLPSKRKALGPQLQKKKKKRRLTALPEVLSSIPGNHNHL